MNSDRIQTRIIEELSSAYKIPAKDIYLSEFNISRRMQPIMGFKGSTEYVHMGQDITFKGSVPNISIDNIANPGSSYSYVRITGFNINDVANRIEFEGVASDLIMNDTAYATWGKNADKITI